LSQWYLLCSPLKLFSTAASSTPISYQICVRGQGASPSDWAHSTAPTYPFSAYLSPDSSPLSSHYSLLPTVWVPFSRSLSSGLRSSLALHSAHYGGSNVKCSGDGFRGTLAYHHTPPSFHPGVARFRPLFSRSKPGKLVSPLSLPVFRQL
jgi:hypothetical protein